MALRLADGTAWADTLARAVAAAPEAFDADHNPRNLVEGGWRSGGTPSVMRTPVDNSVIVHLPRLDADAAAAAVASVLALSTTKSWLSQPYVVRRFKHARSIAGQRGW